MNLNFLCCVGAELKNSTQQTTRMPQIYFYRAFENETVDDMLAPGFFNNAMGIIRQDDLLLLYGPREQVPRYVYAFVSQVDRDGVVIEKLGDVAAANVSFDDNGLNVFIGQTLQAALEHADPIIKAKMSDFADEITLEDHAVVPSFSPKSGNGAIPKRALIVNDDDPEDYTASGYPEILARLGWVVRYFASKANSFESPITEDNLGITRKELDEGLGEKQDTMSPGFGIKITDGTVIEIADVVDCGTLG